MMIWWSFVAFYSVKPDSRQIFWGMRAIINVAWETNTKMKMCFKDGGGRPPYITACVLYSLHKKKRGREMERAKQGLAQTTFAQVVHYCSERTVTCEEISGMRPAHRGDKAGKERESDKDKKQVKLPEGRRKEGYCACALTGCMMKLVFCVVCTD